MAAFAMAASFTGRPAPAGRLLCGAVVVLLLADPFLLHSLGFELSVAATAAIVAFAPALGARMKGPRWLREPLAVSFAAQLGVTPVLLASRGSVPMVSPLANLVAVPLAEPLTVVGFVVAAAAGLVGSAIPAPRRARLRSVGRDARLDPPRRPRRAAVPVQLHLRGALGALALVASLAAVRRGLGGRVGGDAPAGAAVPDDSPR